MRQLFKLFALALLLVGAASCTSQGEKPKAKYIFFFIGDGMTAPQVRLAEAALTSEAFQKQYAAAMGSSELIKQLNIKQLSTTGLATTHAYNRFITDSAAAGTALATGHKTNVGVIGQDAEGEDVATVAEVAKSNGMKVGIVSSVSIDHATPASFYAHSPSRNNYAEISDQLLTSGFDYFGGGSVKWTSRAKRDGGDKAAAYASYRTEAEAKGFKYVTTREEFDAVTAGESKPVIATLDMLANKQYSDDGAAMPYTIDRAKHSVNDQITLADFTAKGIELLDGDAGFFMMVEGGKIDWACHANDAATCAYEVIALDEAIGVAMDFAAQHPDETLIVVTGDHDCGGLAIGFGGNGYTSNFQLLASSKISHQEFSKLARERMERGESFEQLLAFACEMFGFTNEITDGSDGVVNATPELTDYEVERLREAYMQSAKGQDISEGDKYHGEYSGYDPFTTRCAHILNNKSGIDFISHNHTGVPVMVFAEGAQAEQFGGYYDNTDIPKRMMSAAGIAE